MTYIVGGKLNNVPFLMVDCIASGGNKTSFNNKLNKLESSENTFFTLTGNRELAHVIQILDSWLSINDLENDFMTGHNSMNSAIEIFYKYSDFQECLKNINFQPSENRVFFINKDNLVYFDIKVHNSKLSIFNKVVLDNFSKINSIMFNDPVSIDNITNSLYDYCKNEILSLSIIGNAFKDRFSFITFKEEKPIVKYPYKDQFDIINEVFDLGFDKLK